MLRRIGMAAAVAASVGLAVPAEAQWRGGHRPYRHHHRGGIDGGDLLLGAVLAGGVIAVASAASNASRERRAAEVDAEPLPPAWQDRDGPGDSYDDGDVDESEADRSPGAAQGEEDAAADACAAAAEAEGRRLARRATVSEVTDVDRAGDGWFVAGTIELADGYREVGTERRFRCNLADGSAPNVRIDGGILARR